MAGAAIGETVRAFPILTYLSHHMHVHCIDESKWLDGISTLMGQDGAFQRLKNSHIYPACPPLSFYLLAISWWLYSVCGGESVMCEGMDWGSPGYIMDDVVRSMNRLCQLLNMDRLLS